MKSNKRIFSKQLNGQYDITQDEIRELMDNNINEYGVGEIIVRPKKDWSIGGMRKYFHGVCLKYIDEQLIDCGYGDIKWRLCICAGVADKRIPDEEYRESVYSLIYDLTEEKNSKCVVTRQEYLFKTALKINFLGFDEVEMGGVTVTKLRHTEANDRTLYYKFLSDINTWLVGRGMEPLPSAEHVE